MARLKKEPEKQQEPERKICTKCKKNKIIKKDFYLANTHPFYINFDGRYPLCKECTKEFIPDISDINSVKNVLRMLDLPYLTDVWENSVQEGVRRNQDGFGLYIKNLNLNYKGYNWDHSTFIKNESESIEKNKINQKDVKTVQNKEETEDELNDKNGSDIVKILGYDPFESENINDKPYLYSRLVDFLDESTLEDSFKLPAVIEIVKSFNQIDKINNALSIITSDAKSIASNVGGIKSLIDAKEKMLKSVLALAKDNGISVNHNNNKSKGGGTLSGIIKQLQEKGFEEADVNLFDVETCEGMRQVADISNESIMKQLQFDENDYTFMISEQREIIQELDAKTMRLEEENRKMKKKLLQIKSGDTNE